MKENYQYDAIVIGSGISGGWAAKELSEKGLKTLVLERGRDVQHVRDYPTTNLEPWELEHRGALTYEELKENPVVSKCYAFKEDAKHFFAGDKEHPYHQEQPFDWIRGYQLGGKSLIWARQTQRWSNFDFEGPLRDRFAVDWPIRYEDLAPWYSYVEKFAGISGNRDGLATLPDGDFLPPMEMSCVEKHFQKVVSKKYKDRHVIIGRCAHITEAQPVHLQQGRVNCQYRNLCRRGCLFGGYFSSNAATLPWALKTGNLSIRTQSIVESILYDTKTGRSTGVRVIDAVTNAATEYFARIIFVNASTLATNQILLNSKSSRFPQGLGNDNGLLGKYLAFHNYRGKAEATYNGLLQYTTNGRRPNGAYIPRFRNVHRQETGFLRGYAVALGGWRPLVEPQGWGGELRQTLEHPKEAVWKISAGMMGETIPKESNYVSLHADEKDQWGIPLLKIHVQYDDNDEKMLRDYFEQMKEMFDEAGFSDITVTDTRQAPGLDIHEMGGVRMGNDPATSLLNRYNQLHTCKNVFVTDGACMTSTGTQNPSLTYMALTARACDYVIRAMKNGSL
ncbi:GMC family oxidoreductase [Niabella sp. CC-SYL272]|uniref:GMC oxidoreductase n=1 Tax=Niabella agricola TaxID=2891571 RepID=UPI001F1A771E|nr:GMC family oxidoreductase [Niabella agricola]MCF3111263.1 GMC family oxidoreductase [Niabella agricola]